MKDQCKVGFKRIKRKLNYVYKTWIQSDKNITLINKFGNNLHIQTTPLGQPYNISDYSPKYLHQWITLLNTNHEFGYWDEDRFKREMLVNIIPGTSILLFNHDVLIGACAAFYLESYKPYPVLAYPIVIPEYRNQGLGTYLVSKTLERCQLAGYSGVVLNTQSHRASALHVYHKLGFVNIE